MSKRRGANSKRRPMAAGDRSLQLPFTWWSLTLFSLILTALVPPDMAQAEQVVVRVVLNQEEKGDFFVDRSTDGDFLVKKSDLAAMGFRAPAGNAAEIDGETYLSVRSMKEVTSTFDEETLSLSLTAAPPLLGLKIIDFKFPRLQKVYYPNDSSAFLNYGVDYVAGSGFAFKSASITNQVGIRAADLLFLNDAIYRKETARSEFVRLQTSLTYDDRANLRRVVGGDFFATSGELGSGTNMAGIGFAKAYRIDPYFINYPTMGITGQASLPSDASIYLNGMLMKTEKLSPGEFSLRNMVPYGGAGELEIVLKDPFGREERITRPFYFADALLLDTGLHDYSYGVGFRRKGFGSESNRYSDPVFSGFHRYGVNERLTAGFGTEGKSDLLNVAPQVRFLVADAGVMSLALAGSTGTGATGAAAIATHLYQGRHWGVRVSLTGGTRNYANLNTVATDRTKYATGAGISYSDRAFGSLSFDYSAARKYVGIDTDTAAVVYNRNLTRESTVTATFRRVATTAIDNQFLLFLNYTPRPDLHVNAGYDRSRSGSIATATIEKNLPVGEGLGYRATVSRSDVGTSVGYGVNPDIQYNGRYGLYEGEVNLQEGGGRITEQYRARAAGSIVYVGKTAGLTRPVTDSFGLVRVGNLEGVKVLLNSQEVGTTDAGGKLFVPNLGSYYDNQLAIEEKGVSMEYFLAHVVRLVSPPLRSGSCINFVARKLQQITGMLKIRKGAELVPAEFAEATIVVDGREIAFPTGTGGEFFVDPTQSEDFRKAAEAEETGCPRSAEGVSGMIPPGTYRGTVTIGNDRHPFTLVVPASTDQIIDLGTIATEALREGPLPEEKPVPPGHPAQETGGRPGPAPAAAIVTGPSAPPPREPAAVAGVVPTALRGSSESEPAPQQSVETADKRKTGSRLLRKTPEGPPHIEVFFRFGTTRLASKKDSAALARLRHMLQREPGLRVVVIGHADQIGSAGYNMRLSRMRATTVARALTQPGDGKTRTPMPVVRYHGKSRPKCLSLHESCRSVNRRVEIFLERDGSEGKRSETPPATGKSEGGGV